MLPTARPTENLFRYLFQSSVICQNLLLSIFRWFCIERVLASGRKILSFVNPDLTISFRWVHTILYILYFYQSWSHHFLQIQSCRLRVHQVFGGLFRPGLGGLRKGYEHKSKIEIHVQLWGIKYSVFLLEIHVDLWFSFSICREQCSVHPWGSNFVTFHHIPFLTLYM